MGYKWFRELKNDKFRVYYLIYDLQIIVLFVGVSDKKTQQSVINIIKSNLKSTEFSTGLGPVAKNATSHGENSGSPKESGRARSLTGGAAFLFDIFKEFVERRTKTL
ncbi:hypothetical protein J4437_07715 [Candidatus Woesearchaeota archaeon]|nr:hypothetical protein [Candidatus Woesearchaeota archaeon]